MLSPRFVINSCLQAKTYLPGLVVDVVVFFIGDVVVVVRWLEKGAMVKSSRMNASAYVIVLLPVVIVVVVLFVVVVGLH